MHSCVDLVSEDGVRMHKLSSAGSPFQQEKVRPGMTSMCVSAYKSIESDQTEEEASGFLCCISLFVLQRKKVIM